MTLTSTDIASEESPETGDRAGGANPDKRRKSWRAAVAAALVVAGCGAGWAVTRPSGPTVAFASGTWTTPADHVLAIDWSRTLFEKELGTVSGGIVAAQRIFEYGCPVQGVGEGEMLRAVPGGRSMTQRQFATTYGMAITTAPWFNAKPTSQSCSPRGQKPADLIDVVRDQLLLEERRITAEMDFQKDTAACYAMHPEVDDRLVQREIDEHRSAIDAGNYGGMKALRSKERLIALGRFRCEANNYVQRRAIEQQILADYLKVPGNRDRVTRARTLLKELNLDA